MSVEVCGALVSCRRDQGLIFGRLEVCGALMSCRFQVSHSFTIRVELWGTMRLEVCGALMSCRFQASHTFTIPRSCSRVSPGEGIVSGEQ